MEAARSLVHAGRTRQRRHPAHDPDRRPGDRRGADFRSPALAERAPDLRAGRRVCFDDSRSTASRWGSFTTAAADRPSPVGTPAPAIPTGRSLTALDRRRAARPCSRRSDDTDNSAADFAVAAPLAAQQLRRADRDRLRAVEAAVAEAAATEPRTRRSRRGRKARSTPTRRRSSSSSDEQGSSFECKLDRKKYKACDVAEEAQEPRRRQAQVPGPRHRRRPATRTRRRPSTIHASST